MLEEFEEYLKNHNLSANTITSYSFALKQYLKNYNTVTRKNLKQYKLWLIETYKPETVNLRIRAINCYLESINKVNMKIPPVKIQHKNFLENVISEADYIYFKNCLKSDDEMLWYFVIRFLAATGARISELLQIKVEHINIGYLDLYSKGGKLRRIYFPEKLCMEMLSWLEMQGKDSGFIFVNRRGQQITPRGISWQLKVLAKRYRIPVETIYPHSFRHRFAKNFLSKFNDISLLADLMGHESIDITYRYAHLFPSEQIQMAEQLDIERMEKSNGEKSGQ